jgi:hypothetical protein
MSGKIKIWAISLILVSLSVLPALADRTPLRTAWNLFTPQQDIEMGRILAGDATGTLQFIDDHDANAYIHALGTQLAAHAPNTRYPYQFKIVNDSTINAWALPGGFIYITSGLFEAAENEPQLAGALAHEIAHVVLRHGTAEVSQVYSDRVQGSTRGRVAVNDVISRLNIRFEPDSIVLKQTREEERQAQVLATQIMYDTGFDPRQMTQFFQRIANNRSNDVTDFFDDHPNVSNQGAAVRTELRNLGALPRNLRGDSPDFHSARNRVSVASTNNWPPFLGRSRDTGNTPDRPSTRMVLYTGRDIEFRHPDNWFVSEEGNSISVAPDGGILSGSLAYGMTIATFDPRDSRYFGRNSFAIPGAQLNTTLSTATDQLLADLQQSNPNMRIVRNNERRRVNGSQAMVVELTNDSPLGGRETDWLVTVLRPNGRLWYFLGAAPQGEFTRYRPVFDQMVSSVRFLD